MKTRHARQIRKGITLRKAGDIDRGLKLHGVAWEAFFRTKPQQPNPLSRLWPQAENIIVNRASLLRRLDD